MMELVSYPVTWISSPLAELKKFFSYRNTYEEYQLIKKENDQLKSKLLNFNEALYENERLKSVLNLKNQSEFASITAQVIGRDPNNWNAVLIINKGKNQGIKIGQPVVNHLGVIGKVVEVGNTRSKVMILTDPNFSVAAAIQRSRESGLLTGTLKETCRLRHLPAESDVRLGDQIITSKLSAAFPEGLLIGEVIAIEASPSGSGIECIIQPAVFVSQLEEVLVIKK